MIQHGKHQLALGREVMVKRTRRNSSPLRNQLCCCTRKAHGGQQINGRLNEDRLGLSPPISLRAPLP